MVSDGMADVEFAKTHCSLLVPGVVPGIPVSSASAQYVGTVQYEWTWDRGTASKLRSFCLNQEFNPR